MADERLAVVIHRDLSGGDVSIDFSFPLLPSFGPEPALIGRNWQCGAQLKDTVVALGDLDLGTGFVEVHLSAHLGRKRDHPTRLDAHVSTKCHTLNCSRGAAVRQGCNNVLP